MGLALGAGGGAATHQGQGHEQTAPLARCGADRAAHAVDQAPHHREPQAIAGLVACIGKPGEGLKHGEAVLAGEDRAPVGHLNQELLLARVDRDLNGLLTITVFGAVFDQIFNDLV